MLQNNVFSSQAPELLAQSSLCLIIPGMNKVPRQSRMTVGRSLLRVLKHVQHLPNVTFFRWVWLCSSCVSIWVRCLADDRQTDVRSVSLQQLLNACLAEPDSQPAAAALNGPHDGHAHHLNRHSQPAAAAPNGPHDGHVHHLNRHSAAPEPAAAPEQQEQHKSDAYAIGPLQPSEQGQMQSHHVPEDPPIYALPWTETFAPSTTHASSPAILTSGLPMMHASLPLALSAEAGATSMIPQFEAEHSAPASHACPIQPDGDGPSHAAGAQSSYDIPPLQQIDGGPSLTSAPEAFLTPALATLASVAEHANAPSCTQPSQMEEDSQHASSYSDPTHLPGDKPPRQASSSNPPVPLPEAVQQLLKRVPSLHGSVQRAVSTLNQQHEGPSESPGALTSQQEMLARPQILGQQEFGIGRTSSASESADVEMPAGHEDLGGQSYQDTITSLSETLSAHLLAELLAHAEQNQRLQQTGHASEPALGPMLLDRLFRRKLLGIPEQGTTTTADESNAGGLAKAASVAKDIEEGPCHAASGYQSLDQIQPESPPMHEDPLGPSHPFDPSPRAVQSVLPEQEYSLGKDAAQAAIGNTQESGYGAHPLSMRPSGLKLTDADLESQQPSQQQASCNDGYVPAHGQPENVASPDHRTSHPVVSRQHGTQQSSFQELLDRLASLVDGYRQPFSASVSSADSMHGPLDLVATSDLPIAGKHVASGLFAPADSSAGTAADESAAVSAAMVPVAADALPESQAADSGMSVSHLQPAVLSPSAACNAHTSSGLSPAANATSTRSPVASPVRGPPWSSWVMLKQASCLVIPDQDPHPHCC